MHSHNPRKSRDRFGSYDTVRLGLQKQFRSSNLFRILPFIFFFVFAVNLPGGITATIVTNAFGEKNNTKAVFWVSTTTAIQNALAFFVSGPVGKLSDIIGRKPALYFTVLCVSAKYVSLYISQTQIWYYFGFLILTGLSGFSPQSGSGVIVAYVADSVAPEQRTAAFGYVNAVIFPAYSLGVFVGAVISEVYSIKTTLLMTLIGSGICLVYIALLIPETITGWEWYSLHQFLCCGSSCCYCICCCGDPELNKIDREERARERRKSSLIAARRSRNSDRAKQNAVWANERESVSHGNRSRNESHDSMLLSDHGSDDRSAAELSAWSLIKNNRMLLYTCMVCLFASLPENGIMQIALLYADGQLGLTGKKQTTLNTSFLLILGIVALPVNTILLNFLNRRTSDIFVCGVGLFFTGLHLCIYAVFQYFRYRILVYGIACLVALSFLSYPPLNSMLSRSLDERQQGLGLSILSASRKLTGTCGPLLFGSVLYPMFAQQFHAPGLCFGVAAIIAFMGLFINFGPLKREYRLMLEEYETRVPTSSVQQRE